jgi:hypothetical protein
MDDILIIDTNSQSYGITKKTEFKPSGYHFNQFISVMKNPVVLEIGCDIGDTAFSYLECNPNLILYSIDPYDDYVDWNGKVLNDRQKLYQHVVDRFKPFGERFKLVRSTSDEAVSLFEDEFFDLIFIDGLHTYEQLSKDCDNYYSKLKTGSIFSGHDYTVIDGVNRAVNEFSQKLNKEVHRGENDTWFWIK